MTKGDFIERYGPLLAKAHALDQHNADKRRWPWYGKLFHAVFLEWRCPACKAIKEWTNQKPIRWPIRVAEMLDSLADWFRDK